MLPLKLISAMTKLPLIKSRIEVVTTVDGYAGKFEGTDGKNYIIHVAEERDSVMAKKFKKNV